MLRPLCHAVATVGGLVVRSRRYGVEKISVSPSGFNLQPLGPHDGSCQSFRLRPPLAINILIEFNQWLNFLSVELYGSG
jgi:hypothetical protein